MRPYFYVQSTRESKSDRITREQVAALVEAYLRFTVQDSTVALMQEAFETKRRIHVSYRDAAVIEAVRTLACDTVLSEDLSDGQGYDGVRVENPFRQPAVWSCFEEARTWIAMTDANRFVSAC